MLKYLIPMLLTSTAALADPISAAVAVISTASAYATSTLLFTSAFYHFAAVYALSELSKALAPDVPAQDKATRGYEVSGVSPAAPHAAIYGRAKVGGVIVYKETTDDDKFLHMIIAIAGHQVDEIEEVYFDDVELGFAGKNAALNEVTSPSQYDGKAFVYRHLGTDDQLADPQLMAASAGKWTGSHTLSGVAYVFILECVDGVAVVVGQVKGVLAGNGVGGLGAGCGSADGGFYDVLVEDNEGEDGEVQEHYFYQPL